MSTLTWHLNRLAGTLTGGPGGTVTAPAFRALGAHVAGTSTTASLGVPAGVANGDIIVGSVFVASTETISGLASGFAHAPNSPMVFAAGGVQGNLNILWKRASGADAGTYDFTFSGSTYRAGAALAYSGCVAAGNPWDLVSGSPGSDTAIDNTAGTVTPAVSFITMGDGRKLIFSAADWAGGTWTIPATFTSRMDLGDHVHIVCDKTLADEGMSGSLTATCTGSQKRAAFVGALVGVTVGSGGDVGACTETAVSAANLWAGTVGLTLVDALNEKAGDSVPARDVAGCLNSIAGTTGLTPLDAISRIA